MVAPRFRSERKKKRLRASESVAAIGPVGGVPAKPGGEYCPVVTDPTVLAAPGADDIQPELRAGTAVYTRELDPQQNLRLREVVHPRTEG